MNEISVSYIWFKEPYINNFEIYIFYNLINNFYPHFLLIKKISSKKIIKKYKKIYYSNLTISVH